jgi:alpha-beta hydrolase superfamily lysophospholipase
MAAGRDGVMAGAQGTELFWRWWESNEPRGCLLLVHGLGEHSGRYDEFSRGLAEVGIMVLAFDLRGHGRSQGSRGDVGAFPHFLQDLLVAEELLERLVPSGLPRFLMGHSLGGLICLRRLQVFPGPYAGSILSAPWLATVLPGWLEKLGVFLGLALPGVPFPSGIKPSKVTRDPEKAREWKMDPLSHTRITPRLFREVVRVQKEALGFRGEVECPLLFLVPGADPVARSSITEAFARELPGGEVQVEVLADALHEPLNDLGREEVAHRLVRWLEARMEVPPDTSRRLESSLNLDEP